MAVVVPDVESQLRFEDGARIIFEAAHDRGRSDAVGLILAVANEAIRF